MSRCFYLFIFPAPENSEELTFNSSAKCQEGVTNFIEKCVKQGPNTCSFYYVGYPTEHLPFLNDLKETQLSKAERSDTFMRILETLATEAPSNMYAMIEFTNDKPLNISQQVTEIVGKVGPFGSLALIFLDIPS